MSKSMKKTSVTGKPPGRKPQKPVSEKKQESKDIERAVYDGMQDLRVKKKKP
jgi:hypothetical protein